MIAFLILSVGAGPAFEVVNKCPASSGLVVVNRCPAKAVPVKPAKNGFNCTASFCGANGGAGCPNCPNGVGGQCVCGSKAAAPVVQYSLPASQSSCPNGNCPNSQPTQGYYRRGIFR